MSVEEAGLYGTEQSPGHSGSETSERAAQRVTGRRSTQVYRIVADAGRTGITVEELENGLGIGHGAASAVLTRLHRGEWIVRLKESRNRKQVYVLPDDVDGRETSAYLPNVAYREGYKKPMALEEVVRKPDWSTEDISAAMKEVGIHPANIERIRKLLEVLPNG